jgi:circadian clock protein KaiC
MSQMQKGGPDGNVSGPQKKLDRSAQSPTGISGLDHVLCGGLPPNRVYLIQGDPGVGKTTLALQFLLEGSRAGEKSLYITLSETKEEILEVANSHGWSLDGMVLFELSAMEQHLARSAQNTLFHPSEIELNKTTQTLLDEIERVQPKRIVIDSLSELRLLSETPLRYRRQVLGLKQFFAGRGCTVLLLDDQTGAHGSDLQVQSLAHGVITLEKKGSEYGTQRRRLRVDKLRGVKYHEGDHDYVIDTGGIRVFPRLVASEHRTEFTGEAISSGIKEFDQLLRGGLDRGTSTLLMGPAGTGKSIIMYQHAITAAKRGEKSLIYVFDENLNTIMRRTKQLGMPLEEGIQSGLIQIQPVDPAELSPGELTYQISEMVKKTRVGMVSIDSLNGYFQAMPDERFLTLQLHELLTFLAQHGVVTILTLAQHGLIGTMQSPVDLTYLSDTVILLRFFEAAGKVRKAISVIKKRSGAHEDTIREIKMDQGGIRVGEPLVEFHGILSGIPTFKGKTDAML